MNSINILGIPGSLRKESFNLSLLKKAQQISPENIHINIRHLHDIPLYNDDLIPGNIPVSVLEFRKAITEADAVLISCPEYNYSFTGVLKNALDWISTNAISNLMDGKLVALIGASKSSFGTVRAQSQLRQVFHAMNAEVLNRPEVYVRNAGKFINTDGEFTDEAGIKNNIRTASYAARKNN